MPPRFKINAIRPFLIFTGLFGMGVAQPILNLYGNNPEVFIANRSSFLQILTFALSVTFAPPLLAGAAWWVARKIDHRFGVFMEMVIITIAGFLLASVVSRHLSASSDLLLIPAIIAAFTLGIFGARENPVRDWLTYLVLMPVASLVVFLVFSKSAELLWERQAEAEANAAVANPIPVVMLVFDELPVTSLMTANGQINDVLFPNFYRVAESSYWFRNFATNSIATSDSVPIILSGVLNEDAKPNSSDHPDTLFTLLGESYEMNVTEKVTSLCPDSICGRAARDRSDSKPVERTDGSLRRLLTDSLVVYGHLSMPPFVRSNLPDVSGRWGGFIEGVETSNVKDNLTAGLGLPPAPESGRPSWMNNWIGATKRFATSKQQALHYTHVMAPHIPWVTNPSGTVYPLPEQTGILVAGVEAGYWVENPVYATQGYQRHLSQLGAVDTLLGHYLDELERTGIWDEALVIITADHAVSFEPGSHRRWVKGDNADALYRAPLFVHLPGQSSSEVHDEPTFSIDILPTIIDVLDISVEWELEGLSLLDELPPNRDHIYDHFTGDQVTLGMDIAHLHELLAKKYALMPDTGSWSSVAAVGPFRESVGRSLDDIDAKVNANVFASFEGFEKGVVVTRQSGIVPTILKGRVSIPEGSMSSNVLIAVNGWVRGAGYAIRDSGATWEFSCHVPESAFREGVNQVEILVTSGDGQWQRSVSGAVPKTTYRDQQGNVLTIEPRGARIVQIDSVQLTDETLRVKGFTADTRAKVTPDTLLVFYGDRLAFAGPPNVERGDVPIWFKSENLRLSGFDFKLPAEDVPANLERITVVASFSGSGVLDYALLPGIDKTD